MFRKKPRDGSAGGEGVACLTEQLNICPYLAVTVALE
jgi:hypothetical protein